MFEDPKADWIKWLIMASIITLIGFSCRMYEKMTDPESYRRRVYAEKHQAPDDLPYTPRGAD